MVFRFSDFLSDFRVNFVGNYDENSANDRWHLLHVIIYFFFFTLDFCADCAAGILNLLLRDALCILQI